MLRIVDMPLTFDENLYLIIRHWKLWNLCLSDPVTLSVTIMNCDVRFLVVFLNLSRHIPDYYLNPDIPFSQNFFFTFMKHILTHQSTLCRLDYNNTIM
jgi:hypothetical protein